MGRTGAQARETADGEHSNRRDIESLPETVAPVGASVMALA